MSEGKSYIELDVWKEARQLNRMVYELVENFPEAERYGLISQIKRSSISVPSNIAEGMGRSTSKDTLKFLFIARGSLYELETQFYLGYDLNFVSQKDLDITLKQITSLKKLLAGFIRYYRNK